MTKYNLTEEQKEVFKLIKIIVLVLALLAVVYLCSRAFISKDLFNKDKDEETKEPVEATFNYNKTIIGEMLTRPYDTYYVIMYDTKSDDAVTSQSIAIAYKGETKLYNIDLSEGFNKSFIAEKSNPAATSIEDFKVTGLTLIKVNKGKIVKFLETKETITQELGIK